MKLTRKNGNRRKMIKLNPLTKEENKKTQSNEEKANVVHDS
jgi:hypothetical protein